jgi:translation initiation factor 3 subunit C
MPFHMHINLEMVEAVYLTCAVLLEGPNIAAHPLASQRRVISRPFLRLVETYRNQVCRAGYRNQVCRAGYRNQVCRAGYRNQVCRDL